MQCSGFPPEKCIRCGRKCLRVTVEPAPVKPPKEHPYRLTWMDCRLLKSFRISQDVPEAS